MAVIELKTPGEIEAMHAAGTVVADTLAAILALRDQAVQDVSVEDPPLEEVIAQMFDQASQQAMQEAVPSS